MDIKKRISSFAELGNHLTGLAHSSLVEKVSGANGWFTRSEIIRALNYWSVALSDTNLARWTGPYAVPVSPPMRNILVITAGNIPLVGFHDFLSVLLSGNRFLGKLSSRDDVLLSRLADELTRIQPLFADQIRLQDFTPFPDAVIATGSNNSARYFLREYGHIPHIIRKNRSSAAVLDGSESPDEMASLADDITEFYGLGCRSVSHLFLPSGYSPEILIKPLSHIRYIDPCEPYLNNLRYQKARLSMLRIPHIDAGQVILIENDQLHSPIGVVHYSYYHETDLLFKYLAVQNEEIQCLTGHKSLNTNLIPFGSAQKPALDDYPDNTDTLHFLLTS